MKKVYLPLLAAVIALLSFTSCENLFEDSMKITYSFGSSQVQISGDGLQAWSTISAVYDKYLARTAGSSTYDQHELTFLNSRPSVADKAVKESCELAEKEALELIESGKVNLGTSSFTLEVNALYWGNANQSVVYSKKFGTN